MWCRRLADDEEKVLRLGRAAFASLAARTLPDVPVADAALLAEWACWLFHLDDAQDYVIAHRLTHGVSFQHSVHFVGERIHARHGQLRSAHAVFRVRVRGAGLPPETTQNRLADAAVGGQRAAMCRR